MNNETTRQRGLMNIKRPMLCIAVALLLLWGAVGVGIYRWVA